MRRIIVVLLMLELMSVTCFGAVSEDMNVYVRKDVFEGELPKPKALGLLAS